MLLEQVVNRKLDWTCLQCLKSVATGHLEVWIDIQTERVWCTCKSLVLEVPPLERRDYVEYMSRFRFLNVPNTDLYSWVPWLTILDELRNAARN